MVSPRRGFAHWRILDDWIARAAQQMGDAWHDCRMILRLYDVSYLEFTGLNANRIQDHLLAFTRGQMFLDLPHTGTWQLAEVGFLLQDGEFLPAARSRVVSFALPAPSPHGDQTALLVDEDWNIEEVDSPWDQERILTERRTPRLRTPLRIAAFALPSPEFDQEGPPAKFITKLVAGLGECGHEMHAFVPASDGLHASRRVGEVQFHPLDVCLDGTPLDQARSFARAAENRLIDLGPLDLIHLHEWMAGLGSWFDGTPTVLSMSSLEATRRNGPAPGGISLEIEKAEGEIASNVDCILVPDWLREKALVELGIDGTRVHAFPMEGRLPNEWECPLDYGEVKGEIGVGPLDRLMLFIGPLEHAAGGDLIIEALPVLLQRWPNLRVAFAGSGQEYGQLEHRAGELGVSYAVRLLGHVDSDRITRLLRASEALVLPSRYRVPFDDAVADLARRAGRPLVTTHGGPAHLVRHEETGVITYDNPGSIVWAMDRVMGDPAHAQQMGEGGRCSDGFILNWNEVARRYLELCAACFPQLTGTRE
jgi:glycosyltransferase involved in cell wall biosynthesis